MNPASHDSARDRRLEEILHTYLQAVDAGQAPDRDALLRQHPDLASELAAFFANQEEVAQLARGMAEPAAPAPSAAKAPTLALGEAPVPAPGTQDGPAGAAHYQTDQSTMASPGTRTKSRWLRVTTVCPFSNATAAIRRSINPTFRRSERRCSNRRIAGSENGSA
jgi:GAF domain-containing protein